MVDKKEHDFDKELIDLKETMNEIYDQTNKKQEEIEILKSRIEKNDKTLQDFYAQFII